MKELEILLNRRWVLKAEDKELYYRVRDAIGEVRKFASEKLGCQVTENALLVKMEKIPVVPENFMGILDFSSKEEYAFFCILLMFLEDKDAQEQFILSQLTEYIAANMPGEPVDWTVYTSRRRLIKVLRYTVEQGILGITDGNDDAFMDDAAGEVLYENTGASRYFMRNFSKDITDYEKPEDFLESDWFAMDEDRGIARRHRVYKRLLFTPGMYRREASEEDFEYLKYYGRRLTEDLEQNFDCHVHIHKGSAYVMLGDDCRMGTMFPGNNVISDIVLLVLAEVRQRVEQKEWNIQQDEVCVVDSVVFEQLLRKIKQTYGKGFSKNYREMPESEFVKTVMDEMELWMLIKKDEKAHQVSIYPAAGKLRGQYPSDFAGGVEDE
ncbi:MAG: TIGR02678 family protein [Lachnospiraceae bacterium]|nr:TIGR02678 family protein [Lachnospiraceae bacterium]